MQKLYVDKNIKCKYFQNNNKFRKIYYVIYIMIFISKVKIFINRHAYEDINPITKYIHASAA